MQCKIAPPYVWRTERDVSGRVTADEVNLDRFHNRIRKVCALVAARSKVYLSAATMILIVTLAIPALAEEQVHLKGFIQGNEIDTVQGTTQSVNGQTVGIATHIGHISFNYQLTVDLTNGTGTGSAQLKADNGDTIFTTVSGQFELLKSTPGVGSVSEINTITGGTGQFAGAKGSFTVERLVIVPPSSLAGFTSGSLHGSIFLPGDGSDDE